MHIIFWYFFLHIFFDVPRYTPMLFFEGVNSDNDYDGIVIFVYSIPIKIDSNSIKR